MNRFSFSLVQPENVAIAAYHALGNTMRDLGGRYVGTRPIGVAECQAMVQQRAPGMGDTNPLDHVDLVVFHPADPVSMADTIRAIRSNPRSQAVGIVVLVDDDSETTATNAYLAGCDLALMHPLTTNAALAASARRELASLAQVVRQDRRDAHMAQLASVVHVHHVFAVPRARGRQPCDLVAHVSSPLTARALRHQARAFHSLVINPGTDCRKAQVSNAVTLFDWPGAFDSGDALDAHAHDTYGAVVLDMGLDTCAMPQAEAEAEALLLAQSLGAVIMAWPGRINLFLARLLAIKARNHWRDGCRLALAQTLDQALLDPLTGLFNRKHLDVVLPQLMQASRRDGHDLGLLAMDMNGFKAINDQYGHHAGDALLTALGKVIKDCVRAEDFAVRLGGDEFLVVMPQATAQTIAIVDQRLTQAIAAVGIPAPDGSTIRAGVSIGTLVVDHNDWTATAQIVLVKADRAMYHAKQRIKAGR